MQSVEAMSVSKINDLEVFVPGEENHKTFYNTKTEKLSNIFKLQPAHFFSYTSQITKTMKWTMNMK